MIKPKKGMIAYIRYNDYHSPPNIYVIELHKINPPSRYQGNHNWRLGGKILYCRLNSEMIGKFSGMEDGGYFQYDYCNFYAKGTSLEDILMVERI